MPALAVGPFGLGPFELLLILAVVVIIFGVGRLPEVGGAIGKGIREFRKASKEEETEEPKQITETQSTAQAPPDSSPPRPPVQPAGRTCQKCGTANPAGNKFCSQCGASLEARVD